MTERLRPQLPLPMAQWKLTQPNWCVFAYNDGSSPAGGVLDDVEFWDDALDQTEFEALDDAVSVDRDEPSPPAEFSCLARSSGTLTTSGRKFR